MQVSHQNQAGVSIIICCYNSAKKLPETIKHLSLQKNLKDIKCELVIIDNASKDGTAELAGQLCREYVHNIPFKIFFESNPGLSNARKRGIKEAQYELLLFCDDDNWLNQDYLQIAYDIMMQNNIIGVLGNQCIGEYEVAPPGCRRPLPPRDRRALRAGGGHHRDLIEENAVEQDQKHDRRHNGIQIIALPGESED